MHVLCLKEDSERICRAELCFAALLLCCFAALLLCIVCNVYIVHMIQCSHGIHCVQKREGEGAGASREKLHGVVGMGDRSIVADALG